MHEKETIKNIQAAAQGGILWWSSTDTHQKKILIKGLSLLLICFLSPISTTVVADDKYLTGDYLKYMQN